MTERIAIVGSREELAYARRTEVEKLIDSLPQGTVVITGDAYGVDAWAKHRAWYRGLVCVVCTAPWKSLGKRAGPLRNSEIAQIADRVVAFPNEPEDHMGSGTWDAIRQARAAGKEVEVRHVA
jgi:hypothetical protein